MAERTAPTPRLTRSEDGCIKGRLFLCRLCLEAGIIAIGDMFGRALDSTGLLAHLRQYHDMTPREIRQTRQTVWLESNRDILARNALRVI